VILRAGSNRQVENSKIINANTNEEYSQCGQNAPTVARSLLQPKLRRFWNFSSICSLCVTV
jgi:hypothetical protein